MSHVVETEPFDGEEEAPAPRLPTSPGDIVAGKYEVERIIGAGGMGVVVAAVHLDLQERVAIKFMLPEVATVPAAANRFLREAQATSRLKSEHIARLHDVGRLDDGTPFMVMELLEGESLDQLMQREGALAPSAIVDLVLQAAEPLDEAHRLGIVHRDVKPENLFLAERAGEAPIVKLLDFGISKAQKSITITVANGMMGTATYSSPEQLKSPSDVGPSADVWSLGVILFEGLTGTLPFNGASFPEICASVLHEEPARASARRPDVPPGLDDVVQRCLAKDEASRITSIPELAAALVPFASEEGRALAARVVRRSSRRPDLATTSGPPAAPSTPPAASPPIPRAPALPVAETGAPATRTVAAAVAPRPTDDVADEPAADGDVRPSFAESLTPLGMERELDAVPMPLPGRRRARAAVVGSITAGLGLLLALGVTFASTGRGGSAGDAVPVHATKVAPAARLAATRATSTFTNAAQRHDLAVVVMATPAADGLAAPRGEREAARAGSGRGSSEGSSRAPSAGASRTRGEAAGGGKGKTEVARAEPAQIHATAPAPSASQTAPDATSPLPADEGVTDEPATDTQAGPATSAPRPPSAGDDGRARGYPGVVPVYP